MFLRPLIDFSMKKKKKPRRVEKSKISLKDFHKHSRNNGDICDGGIARKQKRQ